MSSTSSVRLAADHLSGLRGNVIWYLSGTQQVHMSLRPRPVKEVYVDSKQSNARVYGPVSLSRQWQAQYRALPSCTAGTMRIARVRPKYPQRKGQR